MGGRDELRTSSVMVRARFRVRVCPFRGDGRSKGGAGGGVNAGYACMRIPGRRGFRQNGGASAHPQLIRIMKTHRRFPGWLLLCLVAPSLLAAPAKQLWTAKLPGDAKWHSLTGLGTL